MIAEPSQITEKEAEEQPKKRSQYDKVGKYQYLLRKLKALDKRLKAIEVFMRLLAKGLEHNLVFEPEYIQIPLVVMRLTNKSCGSCVAQENMACFQEM